MPRNVKPSQIKDSSRQQQKSARRMQQSQGKGSNILKGIRKLNTNNIMGQIDSTMSTKQAAEELLFTLGVTYSSKKSNYSLKQSQTTQEVIRNPNIIDEDYWSNLRNENIKIKDKFPDKNDPIYEMGTPITRSAQINRKTSKEREKPSLVNMASDIVTLNTGNMKAVRIIESLSLVGGSGSDTIVGVLLPSLVGGSGADTIKEMLIKTLKESSPALQQLIVDNLNTVGDDAQIMADKLKGGSDPLIGILLPALTVPIQKLKYFVTK